MQIRVDALNPIPARVQIVLPGQSPIQMSLEEAQQFVKVLDTTIANAKKAK